MFCSNCALVYVPVDESFIAVIFFSANIESRENVVKTLMILLIIFLFLSVDLAWILCSSNIILVVRGAGREKPVCQVQTAFSLRSKSQQGFIRSDPVELRQTFFVRNVISRSLVVSYLHVIREGKRKLNKDQSSCLDGGECLPTHLASSPPSPFPLLSSVSCVQCTECQVRIPKYLYETQEKEKLPSFSAFWPKYKVRLFFFFFF